MAALQEAAFTGLNGGMNLSKPAYELEDNECRYLQDALLDYQGLIRRRGPMTPSAGFATFTEKGSAIMGTLDPSGVYRIAVLTGDNSNGYFKMLSDDYSSLQSFTWPFTIPASPPSNPYKLVDAKPALGGGIGFGISSHAGVVPNIGSLNNQSFAFWMGANKDLENLVGTLAATRGSVTLTGTGTSWSTQAAPGHFVFAALATGDPNGNAFRGFLGVVKSVQSDTSLTLTAPSPYTTTGANHALEPVRGFNYKVGKGRITTTTASTTVTGATTKFISQYMDETLTAQTGTLTNASAVITGLTSTTNLIAGMRVQAATNIPAGAQILSVDSGTQVTMTVNATGSGAQTISFKYSWNIYRASDMAWIGRVASVSNEISITLVANAALALNNERFIALKTPVPQFSAASPDLGTLGDLGFAGIDRHKTGWLSATYAGRQWYANNGWKLEKVSRVWFSETGDPEAVDLSEYDGDFINAYSSVETDTPIKSLVPAYNGLVVIKENEAFAITGSSPTTFSLKKIYDDGTLSGMSAASYAGGVIWAGREGILYYDGIQTQNVTQAKLGDYYKFAIRSINPNTHRMWATVIREHYFLFIESFAPNVAVIKGATSQTPTAVTIVVNMVTGAMNMWTNVAFRGATETPADIGKKTLILANDSLKARIVDSSALFDNSGRDEFLCDGTGYINEFLGITTAHDVSLNNRLVSSDTKYFNSVTTNANGQISAITARMWVQIDGSATVLKAGIYADSAGSPGALLGTSNEVTIDGADDSQGTWRTFTFATPIPITASTVYWIGLIVGSGTCVIRIGKTGTDPAGIKVASDVYAGGFEDPFGTIDDTQDGKLVMYATAQSAGPDFYLESKKYTMGNSMIKKLFKQLSLTYMVQGDALKLDTVLGNQNIGRTARSEYPNTVYTWAQLELLITSWDNTASQFPTWDALVAANFRPRRIKFLKRSQMLAFRLYQKSQAVSQLQLGPFQIAYKWQRIGKI